VKGCWLLLSTLALVGCASQPPREKSIAKTQATSQRSTQPTTASAATQPAAPSANTVTAYDFDKLWNAAADEARGRMFVIDRRDYRGGVLTTEPLLSAQFFEPWRRDALKAEDVAESSLASIRRTIRLEFTRNDDGTFSVVPHVLVERYAATERRITNAMMYRAAFRRTTATGTRERDRGIELPQRYWYRTGNDPELEKSLAEALRRRLRPA
jgi:hypothetical protein